MRPLKNLYGISRIDQDHKKNYGWYVRIGFQGVLTSKWFPDRASGGQTKALKEAMKYRDALVALLPADRQQRAMKDVSTAEISTP